MSTTLIIIGCLVGLLLLVGLGIVVMLLMRSNRRDVVSDARQGWISRRSEQDEEGW